MNRKRRQTHRSESPQFLQLLNVAIFLFLQALNDQSQCFLLFEWVFRYPPLLFLSVAALIVFAVL